MIKNNIVLNWELPSEVEQGVRIYRSTRPLDINNLPDPLTTLVRKERSYIDVGLDVGDTYYYIVSVYIHDTELFSSQIEATVTRPYHVYTTSRDGVVIKYNAVGTVLSEIDNVVEPKQITIDNNDNIFTVDTNNAVKMYNSDGELIWSDSNSSSITGIGVDNIDSIYYSDISGKIHKLSYTGYKQSYTVHDVQINDIYVDYGDIIYSVDSNDILKRHDYMLNLLTEYSLPITPQHVITNTYTTDIIVADSNTIIVMDYEFKIVTQIAVANITDIYFDKSGLIVCSTNDGGIFKYTMDGTLVYEYNNETGIQAITVNDKSDVFFVDSMDFTAMIADGGVSWSDQYHDDKVNAINITKLIDIVNHVELSVDWK